MEARGSDLGIPPPRRITIRSGRDFGFAVAQSRMAAGLTQEQAAEIAGLHRSYLARIESGLSVQLLDRIVRLLRRLGAQITVTLPDTGQPRPDHPTDREG